MDISFFADHCVPNSVVNLLSQSGYQVIKLRDLLPIDAPDKHVIIKAQEIKSILLTLNGDFSDIITYPPQLYGGIISLQVKNHPETLPYLMDRLKTFLLDHPSQKYFQKKLIIVESHRIRIKS